MKAVSLIRAALAACAAVAALATPALAQPDNSQTLHFTLYCQDGHTWNASFNGGPVAFHLDGGQLFIWKEIDYVTPDQVSGVDPTRHPGLLRRADRCLHVHRCRERQRLHGYRLLPTRRLGSLCDRLQRPAPIRRPEACFGHQVAQPGLTDRFAVDTLELERPEAAVHNEL